MTALRIVEHLSPNHDPRPEGAAVDMLVLHYTGMKTAEEALARLCDPAAKVSAHYTVDRDGRIYRHVPEERRAWHAGVSYWAGEQDINGRSIGIELVNPGHEFGYEPFAERQIAALIDLSHEIFSRHRIPALRVLGHSDIAPARKEDPGELFPWAQLAEFGIGLWPFAGDATPTVAYLVRAAPADGSGKDITRFPDAGKGGSDGECAVEETFLRNLRDFGYGLAPEVDVPPTKAVAAFQRHWRPSKVDGAVDEESARRLGALLGAGS